MIRTIKSKSATTANQIRNCPNNLESLDKDATSREDNLKANSVSTLEVIKELENCDLIQRLKRHFQIKILTDHNGNEIVAFVELRDRKGKLVHVITIVADKNGMVHLANALDYAVTAFSLGINNEDWNRGARLLRERFYHP